MIDLHGLASYIKIRNVVDEEIARTIGRPAHSGHIAEYVAAQVFDIKLVDAANERAIDGHFRSGDLADSSVNIKFGTRKHGMINTVPSRTLTRHPDFYLVLTGMGNVLTKSSGLNAPWVIRQVLLFESAELVETLTLGGVRLGVGTSIKSALWKDAMIYPEQVNQRLILSDGQRDTLKLFWGTVTPSGVIA